MDTETGTDHDRRPGSSYTSPARLALAATLRDLGNALVAHQPDDTLLEQITAQLGAVLPEVEASAERPHAFLQPGPSVFATPVVEGPASVSRDSFPDCLVSGRANPMGIAARLWREDDESVCHVTLGAAFEGAPGRAHGGVVAALFDEAMGMVMSITGTPGFTGRLSVTYRAPTPLGEPLEVRARLTGVSGRKMTVTADMRTGEKLLAHAEGLFITVDTEHFLAGGSGTTGAGDRPGSGGVAGDRPAQTTGDG